MPIFSMESHRSAPDVMLSMSDKLLAFAVPTGNDLTARGAMIKIPRF